MDAATFSLQSFRLFLQKGWKWGFRGGGTLLPVGETFYGVAPKSEALPVHALDCAEQDQQMRLIVMLRLEITCAF